MQAYGRYFNCYVTPVGQRPHCYCVHVHCFSYWPAIVNVLLKSCWSLLSLINETPQIGDKDCSRRQKNGQVHHWEDGSLRRSKQRLKHISRTNRANFFITNRIKDDKEVPVILNLIGNKTYGLLRNLCVLAKPASKSFKRTVEIIKMPYKCASSCGNPAGSTNFSRPVWTYSFCTD